MEQVEMRLPARELPSFGSIARFRGRWWVCPACNVVFPTMGMAPSFCPRCGQRLEVVACGT